jgi:hypothetical protein
MIDEQEQVYILLENYGSQGLTSTSAMEGFPTDDDDVVMRS